ncbi:MAG: hypothetical protein K2Y35_03075 [Burkholderiales bacterium]|nr:hypothetical protein [Burkholderiales bacterium]
MRYAWFILMLVALSHSASAQLEFLTVKEIFQAIRFVAAQSEASANHSAVSPFAPDSSETRMPETFADLAQTILHCYHGTARYETAVVAQTPWDREGRYGGDNSALIRIRYYGSGSGGPYEIDVGLVSRQDQIRTAVVSDSSPERWNTGCVLEDWTKL